MAKSIKGIAKAPGKKSSTTDKKSQRTTVQYAANQPIRIVLDLVITLKDERGLINLDANLLGGADDRKISYAIEKDGVQVTILHLDIDNKKVDNPPNSGTIELDAIREDRKISIFSEATGSDTASLQLTYKGKPVFTSPVAYNFTSGLGKINLTAKLPK